MIKKFSSPKMRNREFVFAPKIEYKLVAERSEANQNSLTFPVWCRWWDLNPQPLRDAILSRARMPIPPHRLVVILNFLSILYHIRILNIFLFFLLQFYLDNFQ